MRKAVWTWVASLAVLFGGLTNAHAHVHYCFDGQEPPAAVHLTDGIDHAHEHPGLHAHDDHDGAASDGHHSDHDADHHGDHDDLDLDVPNQALAKVVKQLDQPTFAPLPAWQAPLANSTVLAPPLHYDIPPTTDPPHFRPPSRGPPL